MSESKGALSKDLATNLIDNLYFADLVSDDAEQSFHPKKPQSLNHALLKSALFSHSGVFGVHDSLTKDFKRPDKKVVKANVKAKKYVEEMIGPTSEGALSVMPSEYESNSAGFCTAVLGNIATRDATDTQRSIRERYLSSHLVHEQAHSTALPTRKTIVVSKVTPNDEGGKSYEYLFGHSFGMSKIKIDYDKQTGDFELGLRNEFLEEAFAEETASRYRAKYYRDPNAMSELIIRGEKRSLPMRYVSRNENDLGEKYFFSKSAFPAYLVNQLSEYAGVDIYELMVLSRDPEYEVEAKREIVQVLEGIEKGLYRKLRELPYPKADAAFFEVYDEIMALTERDSAHATDPDALAA